jgi:hypothetical protein
MTWHKSWPSFDARTLDETSLGSDGAVKQHLVALPTVFHVNVGQARLRYDTDIHDTKILFEPVDIPLTLDLSPYFSDKCPPPVDACTVYDLWFVAKVSPMTDGLCRECGGKMAATRTSKWPWRTLAWVQQERGQQSVVPAQTGARRGSKNDIHVGDGSDLRAP